MKISLAPTTGFWNQLYSYRANFITYGVEFTLVI